VVLQRVLVCLHLGLRSRHLGPQVDGLLLKRGRRAFVLLILIKKINKI
jgi:hypothetical protein